MENADYLLVDKKRCKHLVSNMSTQADLSKENVSKSPSEPGKCTQNSTKERKEKESKEEESKKLLLLLSREEKNFDPKDSPIYAFQEACKTYHTELVTDKLWQEYLLRSSGKGSEILQELPNVMFSFDEHICCSGETHTIHDLNDYKYRFMAWWRCNKFRKSEQIMGKDIKPYTTKNGNVCLRSQEEEAQYVKDFAKLTLQKFRESKS